MSDNCLVCGSLTITIKDSQYDLDYFYCPSCQFLFQDRAVLLSHQDEKAKYLNHINTLENKGYVQMFNGFLDKGVSPFMPESKGLTALDFGCGPGPDFVLSHLLEQRHFITDRYDPYFTDNELPDKTYHLITSTEVFEHLSDPIATLKLLKSRLKTNGILSVMTLFHTFSDDGSFDTPGFLDWWYRRDSTHISFFTPRTFQVLCRLCDFNLELIDDRNIVVLSNPD